MFGKLLIANRGEIAVRIARTCRELGIATVAVYSDPDRASLHVRHADEARRIGPAPSTESYLNMDAIVEAARATGAEAIHPGYGFLAENADFARRCREEGLVFVGPPPDAVALMGDKAAARRLAREAGVPVVPGSDPVATDEAAAAAAASIGYPLVIKATAGGGGKGMRVVRNADELAGSLRQARSEAAASFGDDTVYLEKLLERPRHVEIQILADGRGTVVPVLERECSIQRRHQKLVEECPSPAVDAALRRTMGEAAVALARAGGYENAGTVEFLLDADGKFYFLEMNARLQVEHPVTEMVTGLDLVAQQLRIAAGEPLGPLPTPLEPKGWAMEFRITAEDPAQGFLPSPGRIDAFRPAGGPGVRNDEGIDAGGTVTPHYDPLVAKLVVWGRDRAACLARARRALGEYRVVGIPTTIPFFEWLVRQDEFVRGELDVAWVDRRWSAAAAADDDDAARAKAALVAAAWALCRRKRPAGAAPATVSAWRRAALLEQAGGLG